MIKKIIIIEEDEKDKKMELRVPLEIKGNMKILEEEKEGDRIIAGYASLAVIDIEDQFIPVETLQEGIRTLLEDPHYSNLMLVHKNIQIGKIIDTYGEFETHVDEHGLFIVCEIRKDIKVADEIWNSIVSGDLNGFSIGCEVLLSHDECDDEKCVTVLDKINIFEVSVCSEPINSGSGFIVISKAKLNEDNPVDVCPCVLNKEDNMVKRKKSLKKETTEEKAEEVVEEKSEEEVEVKSDDEEETETEEETKSEEPETEEETTEEKSEPTEVSIMDRIDRIERAVNSIIGRLQEKQTEEEVEEEEEEYEEEEEMSKSEDTAEEPKEEEKAAPWGSMDPSNQQGKPAPPEMDATNYPTIKSAIEELSAKMDSLLEKLSQSDEMNELNQAVKARDDKISELEKKLNIVTKSLDDEEEEEEQKTVEEEIEDIDFSQTSTLVIKGGVITRPL